MIRNLFKILAFLKRDFLTQVSYRVAFIFQIGGVLLSTGAFYFFTKMIDPSAEGLDGIPPFDWLLVGLAFQFYFSTALYSFSAKIRNEQLLGTLEAMLVSPTPTGIVIFSSAAWDFTYGTIRMGFYLLVGWLFFDVALHGNSLGPLALGLILMLLSSAGLGILSASFILYFKRGDPINFFLSGLTVFFGTVFFPVQQLPEFVRPVSELLPITWALRVARKSLLQGASAEELYGELIRLAILTVVLLPLGLLFSRVAIRKAKKEGSLIQY
ncbi:MAG: ABC transporter permease [Acidobacteriota bacterium]|nr:ABC transporter permease [Acidobacteriota bacterium]